MSEDDASLANPYESPRSSGAIADSGDQADWLARKGAWLRIAVGSWISGVFTGGCSWATTAASPLGAISMLVSLASMLVCAFAIACLKTQWHVKIWLIVASSVAMQLIALSLGVAVNQVRALGDG